MLEVKNENPVVEFAGVNNNMAMPKEVEKELNIMNNLKLKNREMIEDMSKVFVKEYGSLKRLNVAVHKNRNGKVGYVNETIAEMIEKLEAGKSKTIEYIKKFVGPVIPDGEYNIYQDFVYIDTKNYTINLLGLYSNFERRLLHLNALMDIDFKNKAMCVTNCYIELKSMGRKLKYAFTEAETSRMNLEASIETYEEQSKPLAEAEKEDYEYCKEMYSRVTFEELSQLFELYNSLYNDICEIGDYIFVYLGQYEEEI